jgi:hypothetical protein
MAYRCSFPSLYFSCSYSSVCVDQIKKCDGIGKEPRYHALFCCQIIILRLTNFKQVGYDFFRNIFFFVMLFFRRH